MHNKTRELRLDGADIFVQEKVNSNHRNKIYRDFKSRWQFQMTPLSALDEGANISDTGAEGRTAGAQFYGRSFGDKLVICMSCRPQSRMQGCLIIPLQMRIIIKLQVCQHFHQ